MSQNRKVSPNTLKLFECCESGNLKSVLELIHLEDVDLDWKKSASYGASALIVALMHKHTDIAEALIEKNADVTICKTPDLNTALHKACSIKSENIVKLLLKQKDTAITQGVDQHEWNMVLAKNQYGNTPLHSAAVSGAWACMELLIKAGADVMARNEDQSTPLHHACYCEEQNKKAIEVLLEAGAETNAMDANKNTPLLVAAKKNHYEGIPVLLKAGANKESKDEHGHDAIYHATQRKFKRCIELL